LRDEYEEVGYDRPLPQTLSESLPLTEIPGLSRIDTAGGLWEEAEKMHHCIRSYLDQCLKGWSEIYHINHGGQEATARVNADGNIVVHGPNNSENKACEYGRTVLGNVLKSFKDERERVLMAYYGSGAMEANEPIGVGDEDIPF
jgi:hypothetical protein